jgi:hypothetical protein
MRPSTSLTTARCAPLNLRKARLRRSLRKHGGTPLITRRPLSSRLLLGKRRLWFATKIGATAATPVDRKSSLSALVAINRRREALRHPPSLTFRRFVARRRAWQSRLTTTTRIRTVIPRPVRVRLANPSGIAAICDGRHGDVEAESSRCSLDTTISK